MTEVSVLFTSCFEAMWDLKSRPMSSILALAAMFLALSVRFLKMIWKMGLILTYFTLLNAQNSPFYR